jgi:uncharacterized repeat protein (TIGR03943 family)
VTLLTGAVLLRLALTGTYQRYVRVGMGPVLVVAGVVLVALGLVVVARALRGGPAGGTDHDGADHDGADHGHADHDHTPGVGWLLLAPIAALLLVAPPTLGSYGVDRAAAVDVRAGASDLPPLDPSSGPVPLSLTELSQRALDHDGDSLDGVTVQLTGFVADEAVPFRLARYQIACCAVDAAPVVVRIDGTLGDPPRRDAWVTVTGTFAGVGDDDIPTVTATTVTEIPAPDDPYE